MPPASLAGGISKIMRSETSDPEADETTTGFEFKEENCGASP